MSAPVMCPYCGPWNEHPDGVEMELKDISDVALYWMQCPVCWKSSPVKSTPEAAREAARRRFKPMQKPLTLEEVKQHIESGNVRPLRIEFNPNDNDLARTASLTSKWRNAGNIREIIETQEDVYSIDLRFWWEEPTDEECRAAKWEVK